MLEPKKSEIFETFMLGGKKVHIGVFDFSRFCTKKHSQNEVLKSIMFLLQNRNNYKYHKTKR